MSAGYNDILPLSFYKCHDECDRYGSTHYKVMNGLNCDFNCGFDLA